MKPGKLLQDLTIDYEDIGIAFCKYVNQSVEDYLYERLEEPLEALYENYLSTKWRLL